MKNFMLLGAVAFSSTLVTGAWAQANQRPLSDFINAQGTTMVFTPPAPDQLGFETEFPGVDKEIHPAPVRFALMDYTGLTANVLLKHGINLGTTVSGTVLERPLADGSALVTVDLQTKNALGWAMNLDPTGPISQFNNNPLLFGYRAQDLIANPALTPALGDVHFHVEFVNTAPGAALPDLVCGCFDFDFIFAQASITGPLHAPVWPEGTPGRLSVAQTGLIKPGVNNGFKGALVDAFPAESIDLKPIGQ
jgi:hypothetical protein